MITDKGLEFYCLATIGVCVFCAATLVVALFDFLRRKTMCDIIKDWQAMAFYTLQFLSSGRSIRLTEFSNDIQMIRIFETHSSDYSNLLIALEALGYVTSIPDKCDAIYTIEEKGLAWLNECDKDDLNLHIKNTFKGHKPLPGFITFRSDASKNFK